ncbi:MAG: NAD(P)H-hydrate dehydratase, partial [Coriobacteriia bacterium]|nr:NAD(P)H-hydrate dehydratase [Coriobacteriia bacterium]
PLVLDADGLNALAEGADALSARRAATILTPHPGEAARLLGSTPTAVQSDRIAAASALAETGAVCLLKGSGTIVVGAGRRALVRAGNAGLARAGSGDVLSGMIATLLSQGLAPFDAAVLGAHLHGRAAEYGTERFTETCFTAADIESFLPDAVRELLGG